MLAAYFHPSKTVLVEVNRYGEAHADFIVILGSIPLISYAIFNFVTGRLDEDSKEE